MRTLTAFFILLTVPQALAFGQIDQMDEPLVPDSVRAEILGFLESYYDALSDRDWERFERHFWPDATIVTVWQPPGEPDGRVNASTIRQFIELAPRGPGSREIFEERMTAARVHPVGDLATVFARYHARFGDPGRIMEWDGLDHFSLLRFNGQWRIVSLSFAPDG